jgi:prepilin-type processing-associated H-X9-DG protein
VFDRHPDRAFGQDVLVNPANQMILWDRRPFRGGMRSVLFADAHVERMPEGAFQQRLQQLDAFVKEHVPKRKAGGEL